MATLKDGEFLSGLQGRQPLAYVATKIPSRSFTALSRCSELKIRMKCYLILHHFTSL